MSRGPTVASDALKPSEEAETALHALVWEDAQIILTGNSPTQTCHASTERFYKRACLLLLMHRTALGKCTQ